MARFIGPRLKVERANEHIGQLNAEIRNFSERKPYRIVLEAHANPGMAAFTIRIKESIPERFALIIGDIVHNLRAALDQTACAIIPNGTTDRDAAFPIAWSQSTLETAIEKRHIDRADPKAVNLIRSLKPYNGGNDHLTGLRDLDDTDKHRLLIPVITHMGVTKRFSHGGYESVILNNVGILHAQDGQVPIAMGLPDDMKLGDELDAAFGIAFSEAPFENALVTERLALLASYVLNEVIVPLEPFG